MRYLLLLSLLIPAAASAEEQRIGFVAGSTYGVGLGYSKQYKDGRGWQVSALPIVEDDFDATIFLGGTMFQTLNSNTWGRAYWSLGMAAFYTRQSREEWDTEGPLLDEGVMLSFGPGVGLERRWKQFAVSLELPLAVQVGFRNQSLEFLGMHPIPNFSLMYFW
tara:strand:- start:108 stop:596 length:489 start_codon:yes stop_codon:yes gene_type:complete